MVVALHVETGVIFLHVKFFPTLKLFLTFHIYTKMHFVFRRTNYHRRKTFSLEVYNISRSCHGEVQLQTDLWLDLTHQVHMHSAA